MKKQSTLCSGGAMSNRSRKIGANKYRVPKKIGAKNYNVINYTSI